MAQAELEIGINDSDQIVINYTELTSQGPGRFEFTPTEARHLADLLIKNANKSDHNRTLKLAEIKRQQMKENEAIPVDRSARVLTDGSPVTQDALELQSNGQQKGYVVLSPEERAKGFVRPVRRSYIHEACGVVTTMGLALCETYARDPKFYSGTFCSGCSTHFPVKEFKWTEDGERVGS